MRLWLSDKPAKQVRVCWYSPAPQKEKHGCQHEEEFDQFLKNYCSEAILKPSPSYHYEEPLVKETDDKVDTGIDEPVSRNVRPRSACVAEKEVLDEADSDVDAQASPLKLCNRK